MAPFALSLFLWAAAPRARVSGIKRVKESGRAKVGLGQAFTRRAKYSKSCFSFSRTSPTP